jgi:hypothetical protein
MTQKISMNLDRILWKWWVGKDSDNQEAFDDLIDTIIINKDDLEITPWLSSMMSPFTFNINAKSLETIQKISNDLTLEEFINGCLKYLRAEEEKLKATFKIQ